MNADLNALKREARKKGTPPERLLELAKMGPELAREMARSENTPPEVLVQLVEICSGDAQTLQKLAENPHLPEQELEKLMDTVPIWVASNKSASPHLLQQLSNHPSPSVRQAILFNPATPLEIIQRLVNDAELPGNAFIVMQMEQLTAYARGLKHTDEVILRAIILTDFIPAEAALALTQHPNPEIRRALLQHSDKVAQTVRPQILAQLQGVSP